jgi:hypothetical protein
MNYINFFTSLGKLVKWNNLFATYQSSSLLGSSGAASDIQAGFSSNPTLVSGLSPSVVGWAQQVSGWESQLLQVFGANLWASIQGDVNSPSQQANAIIPYLYLNMVANSQTINRNTSTIAFTTGASNKGNGTLLVSALNNQTGISDERLLNETVQIQCTADGISGGVSGGEAWSITGFPTAQQFSTQTPGSGSLTNGLNTADQSAGNILSNGSFDSYSSSGFTGWTIESLGAGTWYGSFTYVNSSGQETTPSPVGNVTLIAGQAATWQLGSLPTGAVSMNFYLSESSTVAGSLQKTGITASYISTTQYSAGRYAPTSTQTGYIPPPSAPTLSTATTGGSLAASTTYTYEITALSGSNETTPSTSTSITTGSTTATNTVTATWTAVPGATGYNIYGRVAGSLGLIGTTTSLTFTDTGSASPGVAPPATNDTGLAPPASAPTVAAYTPGSSVTQSLNYYAVATGGGSLALTPNSGGDVVISQSLLNMNRTNMWALMGYLSAQNLTTGSTLTIDIEDVTASTAMSIWNADPSTITADFTIHDALAYLENIFPPPVLRIRWAQSSTQGSTAIIYVDAMSVIAATNFGNWNVSVARGTTDFRVGDIFTVTTTNNNAGIFQTYLGTNYNGYLPSSTSPTIADSLAT